MATIDFTVPDDKVPLIRAAFRIEDPPGSGNYRLPTLDEFKAALKAYVRQRVADFRVSEAASTAADAKRTEVNGEIW